VGCKGTTFICLHEAVLRVIVSPSWGLALCHHGRSGYQPFSLVPYAMPIRLFPGRHQGNARARRIDAAAQPGLRLLLGNFRAPVFRILKRILCAATPPGRLPKILVGENHHVIHVTTVLDKKMALSCSTPHPHPSSAGNCDACCVKPGLSCTTHALSLCVTHAQKKGS
jgi:hypothetical protein